MAPNKNSIVDQSTATVAASHAPNSANIVLPLVLADGPAFLTVSGTAGVYEDANVFVQNVGTVSAGQLFVCIHPPIFRE